MRALVLESEVTQSLLEIKKKKKEQARLLELSNCVDTKNLDPRHLKLYLPVCIALHVFILNLSGFHDTEFHSFFPKPELRSLNDLSSANVLMTASLSLLPTHWQTFNSTSSKEGIPCYHMAVRNVFQMPHSNTLYSKSCRLGK